MTEQDTPQDEDLRMIREWRADTDGVIWTVPVGEGEAARRVGYVADEYFGAWVAAMRNVYLADPPHRSLQTDLAKVLNYWDVEARSNTPDFLLASYIERCLEAAHILIGRRDGWYGVQLTPGRTLGDAKLRELGEQLEQRRNAVLDDPDEPSRAMAALLETVGQVAAVLIDPPFGPLDPPRATR